MHVASAYMHILVTSRIERWQSLPWDARLSTNDSIRVRAGVPVLSLRRVILVMTLPSQRPDRIHDL